MKRVFVAFFVMLFIGGIVGKKAEAERTVELQTLEIQSRVAIKGVYNQFSGCNLLFMNDGETTKPEGEILPWKVIVDEVEVNNDCGDTLGNIFIKVDLRNGRGMIISSVKISPDYPAPNITLKPGYVCGDGMPLIAEGVLRSDIDPSNKGKTVRLQITTLRVRSLGTGAELMVSGLPISGTKQEINPDISAPVIKVARVGGMGGVKFYTPNIADIVLKAFFFRKTLKKTAIISSPPTSNYPCQVDRKNRTTWSVIGHEVRGEVFYYSDGNPKIFRSGRLPLENIVLEYNGYIIIPVRY